MLKPLQPTPIACALLCLSTTIHAETADSGKVFMLNKVSVAASRSEQAVDEIASTVHVIDSETIESTLSSSLRDLIRYEPGVELGNGAGDASRFGAKGFNIRGMDENRVKITVDGIDQANSFTPSGNPFQRAGRNHVDIDTLKQVEIVKGPASTLYGSDALGGLVAYTTKDPADYLPSTGDDLGGSLKVRYGNADNSVAETLALAARQGDLEALLLYTHRDADEQENHGDSANDVDQQNFDSDNLLAKLQYQTSEQQRLELTLEDYQSETYTNQSSKLSAPYYSDFYYGDDSTQRERVSVSYLEQVDRTWFDQAKWSLDWQHSNIDQETHTLYGFGAPTYRVKDYSQEETLSKLSAQFSKTLDQHQLVYGFEVQDRHLKNTQDTLYPDNPSSNTFSRAVPKVDAESVGFYLQDHINLMEGRLTLTPGIRYDRFESAPQLDANFSAPEAAATGLSKHTSDKFTFRLGSVFELNDSVSAFVQYSQGFKAPEPINLYYASERNYGPGNHFLTLPNPNLEAEKSDAYELGLRMKGSMGNIEGVIFYNDYSNFIEEVAVDSNINGQTFDAVTQSQNIEEASIKGAELRGALWLDEAIKAPLGSSLQFSVAYAEGENKTSGRALESISPLKAVLGFAYDAPSMIWGGSLNWTAVKGKESRDLADATDFATPGYGKLDLNVYYKLGENLALHANLDNLTDKEFWVYEDMRSKNSTDSDLDKYTRPGRNLSLSVKYQF